MHKKRSNQRGSHIPRPPAHPPRGDAQGNFQPGCQAFDLHVEDDAQASWPSISACLIVKDEAENLRPCVESLADLVSEIIVVDTGSSDNTVEIAGGLGAKVFYFPWTGDFAEARNESLAHAAGDWIFWLDADDRLSSTAVAQLKRAAASGKAEAYQCLVHSRTGSGQDVTEHMRLFRNGLGIQFSGAIHETILPSLMAKRLRLAITTIRIDHLGYESEAACQKKAVRNLALIERAIDRSPDDFNLLYYRGQARGALGDDLGAEADLRKYLASTAPRPYPFHTPRFWSYVSLISFVRKRRDRAEIDRLIALALSEFRQHPSFLFELAQQQVLAGRPAEALQSADAAEEGSRKPFPGLLPEAARIALLRVDCFVALSRKDEALRWAQRARELDPQNTRGEALLSSLLMDLGRLAEAEELLSGLLKHPDVPEVWIAAYQMYFMKGQYGEAGVALGRAKALGFPPERIQELLSRMQAAMIKLCTSAQRVAPVAQIQALMWLTQGEHLKAAECFAGAIEAAPTDPDNYRYLAVALDKLGQKDEAVEAWQLATYWQQAAAPSAGAA